MVKVYEMVLTFDTNKPNEELEAEIEAVISGVNEALARAIKDTLPQIYKDPSKRPKIALVPIKPEDVED